MCDSLSESARDAMGKISKTTVFVISILHACLIGFVTGHASRNDESEEAIREENGLEQQAAKGDMFDMEEPPFPNGHTTVPRDRRAKHCCE
jgi:hypothetical protein